MAASSCPACAEPCVEPRLLPCLHSLCAPCLRRLETLGEPGRAAALSVLCPLCDAAVALPPGGLGQLTPDYTASGRGTAGCDLCVDGAAARRCRTCGENLCLFCCQAHRRQKKTASHVVTELESTGDCSQAGKPFFCPSHPAEELRLFCEQCDQPVCRVCVVEGHQQHPYDFTSNVVHRHGDSLRELLRSTQQRMRTLEDVLGQIDDMGSAIHVRAEAVATEICLFASGYVKAIEEHRDRLLKQLEDLKVQKENLLHLRKAQLQQLLMDMRTGVEFTERLLTSGSDLEILITKGVVSSRLAKLNSAAYTTHPSVDESIQFSPQERAGQCHGYEVFGAIICKAVDPAKCTLHGEDFRSARQNELTGFTLLCNDTAGERMGRGGEAVTVTITHKDKKNCAVKSTVCDNGDGTYHVSYSPEEPGLYAVCVYVKGQHVQGSPFAVTVKSKFRKHQGVFHCCTFCSSGGQKAARCACGGTMPGGYQGCGHGHKGHPGCPHWSCCGQVKMSSDCLSRLPSDSSQRSLLRTVAL
ncbi:TRI45 protein, partial [Odontophorus gujanensis]|nr:TRI45 protein [Odontophorus gujanensis]